MKRSILSLCSFFLLSVSFLHANCTEAHSSASYALVHTKQALKADNFDHQRYYAGRAIDAFEKTQQKMEDCDCKAAALAIEEALIDLRKAVDPADWKTGRFYTQKALEDAENMMNALELYTSGEAVPEDTAVSYATEIESTTSQKANLLDAQKELEEKQKVLMEQQKELQAKIAKQKELEAKLKKERSEELAAQIQLKVETDKAIQGYKTSLEQLLTTLECPKAQQVLDALSYTKSEASLQNETLVDTRKYYKDLLIKVQQEALSALQNCN